MVCGSLVVHEALRGGPQGLRKKTTHLGSLPPSAVGGSFSALSGISCGSSCARDTFTQITRDGNKSSNPKISSLHNKLSLNFYKFNCIFVCRDGISCIWSMTISVFASVV